jgi:hypothetical protein
VLFSALYSALRLVIELIKLQTRDTKALQAEVLALRQQVRVLERQVKRVRWQPSDRLILSVLRKRLRSTNLLERSLGEVKRRTKVIGRFPRETSCLSLCWAVMDLVIAAGRGLALTDFEHQQLAQMRAAGRTQSPVEMTA